MTQSIQQPFENFKDVDGNPLENGQVYIGTAGLDPVTNQITVYWDSALTTPASQPLTTSGGYFVNSGTISNIYTAATDYSIRLNDSNGVLVTSSLNNSQLESITQQESYNAGSGVTITAAQGAMLYKGVSGVTDVLDLQTNAGSTFFNARDDGKVGFGMGTSAPIGNVQIRTATTGLGSIDTAADELVLENNSTCGMTIISATSATGNINFADGDAASRGVYSYNHSGDTTTIISAGAVAMTIDGAGSIGVGETVPLGKGHFKTGDSGAASVINTADEMVLEGSGAAGMTILGGTASNLAILFGDSDSSAQGQLTYSNTTDSFNIATAGAARAILDSSGNLGVGETATPLGKVHIKTADAGAFTPSTSADEMILESSGDVGMHFIGGSSSSAYLLFGAAADVDEGSIQYDINANNLNLTAGTNLAAVFGASGINFKHNTTIEADNATMIIDSSATASTTPAVVIKDPGGAFGGVLNWQIEEAVKCSLGRQASQEYLSLTTTDTNDIALDLNAKLIVNVKDPGNAQDAATKNYVDVAVSDSQYKTNVAELDGASSLSIVASLNAKSFEWDEGAPSSIGKDEDKGITVNGFIAQDVEAVMPEAIREVVKYTYDEDMNATEDQSYKAIRRDALIPVLWSAVQKLSEKVTTLENA